ncbi:MAG: hypothetical protein B7Z67_13970 [Acidiphilium sp. 21-60-14]|nr:MAG: hypothetical protein B7Z67_13970 [Acidiphilium sp. 21-60-14]
MPLARRQPAGQSFAVRYEPATRLVRLAVRLAATHNGLSLDEMAADLEIGRRTAERLRDRLEQLFPQLSYTDGEDRVRRWRLPKGSLPVLPAQSGIIATLETLARELSGRGDDARAADLRDAAATLRAMMAPAALRSADTDIEALMEAEGSAASPGPRLKLDRALLSDLRFAILGMKFLQLKYRPAEAGRATTRTLCPYGILYGRRAYLIAHTPSGTEMRLWRIDRISDLQVLPESFKPLPFDISAFAAQSFGVFQEPPQNVVLRFKPEAAEDAAEWIFHPSQIAEPQADGSLIVRFRCGGMRELSWHLFTWGPAVDIIAPEEMKVLLPLYDEAQR